MVDGSGYQSTYDRWGDYSHLTLDPDDHETFWYTQEYYVFSGTNWHTHIGAFKISGGSPPDDGIKEAVDSNSLSFVTTGDANWAKVTDAYFYDDDSAKSGTITHNQSCSIETTINYTSAKTVKFYWKVSSESSYDYLRFYVDGAVQYQVSGTVAWQQKSHTLISGFHILKWTYSKDGSVSSGPDCGWVDKIEITDPPPGGDTLARAVDNEPLIFTTSGNNEWFSQTAAYYYDNDAAQSPTLTHNEDSSMQTIISGVASVKFYWKVSSESNYDFLKFYIDDALKGQVSGTVDWQQKSYMVSPGSHTLKWTYSKDYSVSSGYDTGWVDKIELSVDGGCTDPVASAVDDDTCQNYPNSGDESWYETTDNSYCGGSSMTIPTALDNNEAATIETTISGFTSVSFRWKVSSEINYDFLEFYIDGIRQDRISGEVDWQQKSYSISSGTHALKWVYSKDYSISSGSDAGWLDCVTFQ